MREHGRARTNIERFQVAANQRRGGRVIFDEDDFACAAAQCLDAHGAGSRKEIDESRPVNCIAQDIEKGFAQTITGGPEREALQALEDAAAVGSGDNAHGIVRVPQPTRARW